MPLATRMRMAAAGATVGGDALADAINALSPIGFWKLGELSGTTAADEVSSPAQDGTFANVTLDNVDGPGGFSRAGLWNGTTSTCDIYSANLSGVFDGSLGTFLMFVKIAGATWVDGTNRRLFVIKTDSASTSLVRIQRTATNGVLRFLYTAGFVGKTINHTTSSPTGWILLGITWNKTGDEMKAYLLENSTDGQVESTLNSLGVWDGSLDSDETVLGAEKVSVPGAAFVGNLSYAALYDSVLTEANFQGIMAATE